MPLAAFDCLIHPAPFVVDGANRICHVPAPAGWIRVAALIATMVCIAAMTVAAKRPALAAWATAVAIGIAALALSPGLFVLAFVRADAPLRAPATAAVIRERMQAFESAAQGLSCVDIVRDECVVCQPLAQLVFRACDPPQNARTAVHAGRAVFGSDGFMAKPCRRDGLTVVCGNPQ